MNNLLEKKQWNKTKKSYKEESSMYSIDKAATNTQNECKL